MLKDNAGNRTVYLPGSGVLEQGLKFVITEKEASSGKFENQEVSQSIVE